MVGRKISKRTLPWISWERVPLGKAGLAVAESVVILTNYSVPIAALRDRGFVCVTAGGPRAYQLLSRRRVFICHAATKPDDSGARSSSARVGAVDRPGCQSLDSFI
jgi:hypothetical protein